MLAAGGGGTGEAPGVQSISPEGEARVDATPTIHFATAMVPLGHPDAAVSPYASIEPAVPGTWRWIGTQTLLFEPSGPWPPATAFRGMIPPGLRDAAGRPLPAGRTWEFRTPAPSLVAHSPREAANTRRPLVVLRFDQPVPPAAASSVRLAVGGRSVPLRPATPAEVREELGPNPKSPDRLLVLRPEAPLPHGATATVIVAAGLPSAAGPLVSAREQRFSFTVPERFRVKGLACNDELVGAGIARCPTDGTWSLQLTGPSRPGPQEIRVEPEVPGFRAVPSWGDRIALRGSWTPGRYRIRIAKTLRSAAGEPLGQDEVLQVEAVPAAPVVRRPWGFETVVPRALASLPVKSRNLDRIRATLYRVEPGDLPRFEKCSRPQPDNPGARGPIDLQEIVDDSDGFTGGWSKPASCPLPGQPIGPLVFPVERRPEEFAVTRLPLAAALPDGVGHVVAVVEGAETPLWIQVTDLGLETRSDSTHLYVWVTSLETARPIAGAEVSLGGAVVGTSDEQGLVRIPLPSAEPEVLVVRHGADTAFARIGQAAEVRDAWSWYTLLDRDLYRPGETVRARVLLRRIERTADGDLTTAGLPSRIGWRVEGDGAVVEGEAEADTPGGFTIEAPLPVGARAGPAGLVAWIPGTAGEPRHDEETRTRFRIEAYRTSEYGLEVRRSAERLVAGDSVSFEAEASYHTGNGLGGAEVSWTLEAADPSRIHLPGAKGFAFGAAVEDRLFRHGAAYPGGRRPAVGQWTGRTDPEGRHGIVASLRGVGPDETWNLEAMAIVRDANGRAWSRTVGLPVYPSAVAVGLRASGRAASPLEVQAVVVDLDGRPVAGRPVQVTVERLEPTEGKRKPRVRAVGSCERTSERDPVVCSFPPAQGELRIVALVEDEQGRPSRTVIRHEPDTDRSPERAPERELALVPDRPSYEPGETARVRIAAPFWPAEGLVTLVRGNVVGTRRLSVSGPEAEVEVPVGPGPELQLEVVLVAPMVDGVPRRETAAIDLPVSTRGRRLEVAVRPRDPVLAPGAETRVDLEARDADGRPAAGATFTVVVVDEALLAITDFRHPDPAREFAAPWPAVSWRWSTRERLAGLPVGFLLGKPEGSFGLGGLDGPGGTKRSATLRSRFEPVAHFAGAIAADGQGRATVRFRVPDSFTRWRVVAVAADERRAGLGMAAIAIRQDLQLRPSPPRFARPGDRFELPVIVENRSDDAVEAGVALRVRGAELEGPGGRRARLAARSRALLRFPLAVGGPGTIELDLVVDSGVGGDAVRLSLPIHPPTIRETVAVYGTLGGEPRTAPTEGAMTARPALAIGLAKPPGALAGVGGLEVATSVAGIDELAGAARWLSEYPLDCAEQSSARLLAYLVMREHGLRLSGVLETPEELETRIRAEVERLTRLGSHWGFRLWPGMKAGGYDHWYAVQAAHALIAAERAGVVGGIRESLREGLDPEKRGRLPTGDAGATAEALRARAYRLFVWTQAGEGTATERREEVRELLSHGLLPAEAAALLLASIGPDGEATPEVNRLVKRLEASIREESGSAHVLPERHGPGSYGSQVRADALALLGLEAARPGHPLAAKLARGLLAARDPAGRWPTTQDNAFALLALAPRMSRAPDVPGDTRVWLGERFLGTVRPGRPVTLPLASLPEEPAAVVLEGPGDGAFQYRVGLRWAVDDRAAERRERGFSLVRRYEATDDPGDVRRGEDGTVHLRAGARVRVTLEGATPVARRQVAVIDRFPAGIEPLLPDLRGSGPDGDRGTGWSWFDHVELGDDRSLAFAADFGPGRWSWSWVGRAPTPGTFVAPPATVEAMYEPEVMGRTAADRIVVEAR